MAIFTMWVKIYCVKHLCNVRVGGVGKVLSSENFWLYGSNMKHRSFKLRYCHKFDSCLGGILI